MIDEHWFDVLNRALVRDGPRRAVLSAAGAIAVSLAAGGLSAEAAKDRKKKGKGKGKGKNKKKGNGKGRPEQCGPDIDTLCDAAFASPFHTSEERKFCKVKCEKCEKAGTAFCIHFPDEDGPSRATCCHFADECCGGPDGRCCAPDRCCNVNDDFSTCLLPGSECCPSDPRGFCDSASRCCPGKGCHSCDAPRVVNPTTCGCECPAGQIECDGACVDGAECPDDGCSQPCPTGATCVDGECRCPAGQTACDGKCVDVLNDKKYCGSCVNVCRGTNECCQGAFCYNTERTYCCPPETHLGTCNHGDTCCDSSWCVGPGQTCP